MRSFGIFFLAEKVIFLIDGSAIMFRSFYGLAPLRTNSGIPTQATYGFFKTLKKLFDKFTPDKVLIAWDSQKSVRREKESTYKAKRLSFPDELSIQRKYIIKIAQAMNIAQLELDGFEADDIIASASRKFSEYKICIVSSDKDLLQLVDLNRVKQFDPAKNILIGPKEVFEIYGFGPEKINFYHSLLGDSTDNIPGAKGIGKKTATELVLKFKSLEDLYQNLNLVEKPRTRALLEESRGQVFLSQELFNLIDCPINFGSEELDFNIENWSLAEEIFKELEFKSFIVESKLPEAKVEVQDKVILAQEAFAWLKFSVINRETQLEETISQAKHQKIVSFDLETTGLNFRQDKIVGFSFAFDEQQSFYVPIGHQDDSIHQIKEDVAFKYLKRLLEDESVKKVLQNAKFDIHFLHSVGIEIKGEIFDTMIAARLLRAEWQKVDLSTLSIDYLAITSPSYKDLFSGFQDFSEVSIELAAPYAASDAMLVLKLYPILSKLLENELTLKKLFHSVEMPLLPIIIAMEEAGISLSPAILDKMNVAIEKKLKSLEAKIRATLEALGVAGANQINLLSPKQVEKMLFDDIKLVPITKHKGGNRSTSKDVLEDLAKIHPVPGMIFQYRKLSKLQKTYLEALPKELDHKSGKIYTTFWQTRVATGRLASSDPNLQNVPNVVREAFIADQGCNFISADYSQIELRVLAHLSKDVALVSAFKEGRDIHAQTAGQIFGKNVSEISPEERKVGKRINFSVIYGLSAFSLAREMDISRSKAQEYIDAFFAQYPGVGLWMDEVISKAKELRFVQTLMGRKRFIPGINDKNRVVAQAAQRVAVNTVVQGTAADIMKMAMIELFERLKNYANKAKILLQVHDELLLEVQDSILQKILGMTQQAMSEVIKLDVELVVSVRTGKTWGQVSK